MSTQYPGVHSGPSEILSSALAAEAVNRWREFAWRSSFVKSIINCITE